MLKRSRFVARTTARGIGARGSNSITIPAALSKAAPRDGAIFSAFLITSARVAVSNVTDEIMGLPF
jgi:hypothetical protein